VRKRRPWKTFGFRWSGCSPRRARKGLLAFARKHKLVAGHLTGIGAIRDTVIGYFNTRKKVHLRLHRNGPPYLPREPTEV
jgi:hypothetical protein